MKSHHLFDAEAPMADGGAIRMTAAEEVLAYLLVEVVGAPDDEAYSPSRAQVTIEAKLKEAEKLEEARAEQWRRRREAEGSRDAAKAACDSVRVERDKLKEAMEGICHFSDALNYRDDHLSKALAQWIEAGRALLKEKGDA